MRYLIALLVCLLAAPVAAQSICAQRGTVLKQLESLHQETPIALGITNAGNVVEVIASKQGSFTIIVTGTDGMSCLMAAGRGWQNIKPTPKGPGA